MNVVKHFILGVAMMAPLSVAGVACALTLSGPAVVGTVAAPAAAKYPPALAATSAATPSAAPVDPTKVVLPTDLASEIALVPVAVAAIKQASALGSLSAIAVAALAVTYLLIFLIEALIKDHVVPDKWDGTLTKALAVLSATATVAGYLKAGPLAGAAAGIGAAATGLLRTFASALEAHVALSKAHATLAAAAPPSPTTPKT